MAEPYISVVVAARNDNHGGNMLRRMQAFLDSWLQLGARYGLDAEIVVVEWNPPPGARLAEELCFPAHSQIAVRFLEVAPETHASFANAEAIPLHQMIAKNAGIRRARGEFILATNLDIVASPELIQFLAARRLQSGHLYRMDRCDVSNDLPNRDAGIDCLLEHCSRHVLRVFTAEDALTPRDGRLLALHDSDVAEPGIAFGRGWMPVESQGELRYRWLEREGEIYLDRAGVLFAGAEAGPSQGGAPLRVQLIDGEGAVQAEAGLQGRGCLRLDVPFPGRFSVRVLGANVPLAPEVRLLHLRVSGLGWAPGAAPAEWALRVLESQPGTDWNVTFQAPSPDAAGIRNARWLHVNACGDFTLLSRRDWLRLRGYPELPFWPMHIDTLLCYAAHHAGIAQTVLAGPLRIFHVEHAKGAGWTPEGEAARQERIAALGVRSLDYTEDVVPWIQLMRRWNAPAIFNMESWGLARMELGERRV